MLVRRGGGIERGGEKKWVWGEREKISSEIPLRLPLPSLFLSLSLSAPTLLLFFLLGKILWIWEEGD